MRILYLIFLFIFFLTAFTKHNVQNSSNTVFFILSCEENNLNRRLIRNTWIKDLNRYENVHYKFLITPNVDYCTPLIQSKNNKYKINDIDNRDIIALSSVKSKTLMSTIVKELRQYDDITTFVLLLDNMIIYIDELFTYMNQLQVNIPLYQTDTNITVFTMNNSIKKKQLLSKPFYIFNVDQFILFYKSHKMDINTFHNDICTVYNHENLKCESLFSIHSNCENQTQYVGHFNMSYQKSKYLYSYYKEHHSPLCYSHTHVTINDTIDPSSSQMSSVLPYTKTIDNKIYTYISLSFSFLVVIILLFYQYLPISSLQKYFCCKRSRRTMGLINEIQMSSSPIPYIYTYNENDDGIETFY